jgi:phospholipase/lecithinase/hemolysin
MSHSSPRTQRNAESFQVQRIQLIERANRPVNPLEGFILARVSGGANRALEEVKDLREYQLTMRNSTSTHLQNAEIQFEFPAEDVQAIVSPPTLSRTPLVVKDTKLEKGAKVFRWIIPHFPTGDSVEFNISRCRTVIGQIRSRFILCWNNL